MEFRCLWSSDQCESFRSPECLWSSDVYGVPICVNHFGAANVYGVPVFMEFRCLWSSGQCKSFWSPERLSSSNVYGVPICGELFWSYEYHFAHALSASLFLACPLVCMAAVAQSGTSRNVVAFGCGKRLDTLCHNV